MAAGMTPPAAPFEITPAVGEAGPLVFASPHSGDLYPADMGARAGLNPACLRSAEDTGVDRLAASGPERCAPLIASRIGRAYVDLNRSPEDLDPGLIADAEAMPGGKAGVGYGVVPRLCGDGTPLYDRMLTMKEARRRIAAVHAPYHAALAQLMQAARARHGRAVLIDWHSMPGRTGGVDVVLGDRHGASCRPRLTRRLRALFEGLGWRVALNHPYAGGWSTQIWGRPSEGYEAIQIELGRALYLDEAGRTPGPGWGRTVKGLERVIAALCAEDWA